MSTSSAGALRRGQYVHAVFDKVKGTWLYRNLMNMALIEADAELHLVVYKFLNDPALLPVNDMEVAVHELLVQKRFLIEIDIDEIRVLEDAYHRIKMNPRIASLAIVTTLQCNLRCEYCYQEHVDQTFDHDGEASVRALIRRIIAEVRENKREVLRHFGITWWGGEPLLRIDLIDRLSRDFIKRFDEIGTSYECFMSTNGVLLSESNCRILRDAKLTRVQITIDGPEEFHNKQRFNVAGRGTYKSVLKGLNNVIRIVGDGRRFVTLRVNVTPRMLGKLETWSAFLADLSPFRKNISINISPAVPNDFYTASSAISNKEFYGAFEELKGVFLSHNFELQRQTYGAIPGAPYCGAIPNHNWIVLPGGRLTKCTDKFHDPSSDCGRFHQDGTIELFDRAYDWLNYSPFRVELCRNCSVLPICMGGCRVVPFGSKNGDRCFRKATVEQSLLEDPNRNRTVEV